MLRPFRPPCGDAMDQAIRARAILEGLAHPDGPSCCPDCAFVVLLDHIPDVTGPERLSVDPTLHHIFTSMMRFLTTSGRTAFNLLLRHRCPAHRSAGLLPAEHVLECLQTVSCQLLVLCLTTRETTLRFKSTTLNAIDDGQRPWPYKHWQLFPYGVHETVRTLVQLCTAHVTSAPHVLAAIIYRCRYLVYAEILDQRAEIIHAIYDTLHLLLRSPAPRLPGRFAFYFVLSAQPVVALLRFACTGYRSCECDLKRFTQGFEQLLYSVLLESFPLICRECPAELPFMKRIAVHCHDVLRLPEIPTTLCEEIRWYRTDPRDVYRSLVKHFHLLRQVSSCVYEACRSHVHDGRSAHAFGTCNGCKMVHYCSRACQKAHWRHEAWPHKAVCGILRQVAEAQERTQNLADLVTRCRVVCPEADAKQVILWIKSLL